MGRVSGRGRQQPTQEVRTGRGLAHTLLRGLRLSPEWRAGLVPTLALALLATGGRVVVPITVQLVIDHGLLSPAGADLRLVTRFTLLALAALTVTAAAGFLTNARLTRTAEAALSGLRVRAFRHVHDLSLEYQTRGHRGAMVSRVTSDIDTISQFMQWGGVTLLVSLSQVLLAVTVMLFYSLRLTLVVLLSTAPLLAGLSRLQTGLSAAYRVVRERVADLLTALSEAVMGAVVIRAYRLEARTDQRVRAAVDRHRDAQVRAAKVSAIMFSSGEVFAAVAVSVAIVVGIRAGGPEMTAGRLVAFLFLISLFVQPVQVATEVLDQAQSAIAGWRRVLDLLDVVPEVRDPERGVEIPAGPFSVRFEHVWFAYDSGDPHGDSPWVLRDIDFEIRAGSRVALVGETGSGKTTLSKLLVRLMDPGRGRVLLNGVPLDQVRLASLRRRVVLVPQDGFLFDTTIAENIGFGRPSASRAEIVRAIEELGLREWVQDLPGGLDTAVGERGGRLSVGERQLVALARAWIADPDLLILDEATSAVDPATELRLQHALEELASGRTVLVIAHRLWTAARSDEVVVLDEGRLVERGPHDELMRSGDVYARLFHSWSRWHAPAANVPGEPR